MSEDDFGGQIPDSVDDAIETALDQLRATLLGGAAFDVGVPEPTRQQMARAWMDWGLTMWRAAFGDDDLDLLRDYLSQESGDGPVKDLGR